MNTKPLISLGRAVSLSALLAACGGGGSHDAPPPPSNQVPDSAMASSRSMTDFIKTMREDEDAEPLTLSTVESPQPDAEEPVPGG